MAATRQSSARRMTIPIRTPGTAMSMCGKIPPGLHREFWQHVTGCRQWLVVERDTRNHIIASVGFARKSPA